MNKHGLSDVQLNKREERSRIALDVSQIGVWDWDIDSNSVFYSQQWKRLRGIGGEEGWGTPDELFDSVHPEEKSQRQSQRVQWKEGNQEQFESEYRVEHKGGAWVRISERVKVVRDDEGNVARLIGAETEVLPSQSSPQASKFEQPPFSLRADDVPLALLRFRDQECVYANKFWGQITGRAVKSALGDGYLDAVHPEDRSKFVEFQKAVSSHPVGGSVLLSTIEVRHMCSDGSVKWFLSQVSGPHFAYKNRNDCNRAELMRADTNLTMIDITDRKELEHHQERLTAILQSTTDYICVATTDWKMLWCNQQFSKLRPDLDPDGDVNCIDKYSPSSKKIITEIALPTALEKGIWSGEITILDSEGEGIPVSQVLVAHNDKDGRVTHFSAIMRDVRELTKTSDALHASEAKLASLVATLPVAIFELDANGENYVHLNDRWSELIGRQEKSEIKTDFMDTIHPEDLLGLKENGLAAKDAIETRHLMPDGTVKWILRQTAEMFDIEGNVTGYIGTLTNISKLKEVAESLRVTKDRLQLVLEGTSVGIFEYHPQEDRLIWDQRMMKMYGVTSDDLSGTREDFWQRIPREDLQRHDEYDEQLLEKGHCTCEFQIIRPNGEIRYILSEQLVLRNDQSEIEKIIGLCIDVTSQRTTQQALQETQTQLRVMTDNVPSMLFRYVQYADGKHEMPFVSPGSREIYEVEPEDAMEDSEAIFQRIHTEEVAGLENLILESFQNLTPFKAEHRINLPTKGQRWVEVMSNPTSREDGAVVWDGLAIDITHRKEVEIELRKARMKDEFLANVSHELRTPLNAMLGMNEGLLNGIFGTLTPEQLESLKVIEQSGEHLLGLINEMLDLAKVESGQMELVFSLVEVRDLCESSLRLVAQQADKKKIQLSLDLPFNIPTIKLDEQRIRQVLINLLGNAVKFTPVGGAVSVKVERVFPHEKNLDETLRIAVSDTGIGVDASKLDSLFVPFVQVDTSLNRNHGGTGLGLALVKQYVELHGGQIAVKSELGIGSCFEFTIPYRRSATQDSEKSKISVESKGNATAGNPQDDADSSQLILVAEDNEDIALATCSFLRGSGYRVIHAINGSKAVEMAVEHSPCLILMDIQMPGVDGLEAIRRLREFPELQQTPIIAVTGLARQFDAERCMKAGASEYISKPYRMGDLVKSMQNLLGNRASV